MSGKPRNLSAMLALAAQHQDGVCWWMSPTLSSWLRAYAGSAALTANAAASNNDRRSTEFSLQLTREDTNPAISMFLRLFQGNCGGNRLAVLRKRQAVPMAP